MHLVHLAVGVDLVSSMLQEVTEDRTIFDEPSRDRRLGQAFAAYRSWAEEAGVQDRPSRKMFTTSILTSSKVVEVSQKVLSATACRYMILWAAIFMTAVLKKIPGLPKLYLHLACPIPQLPQFLQLQVLVLSCLLRNLFDSGT